MTYRKISGAPGVGQPIAIVLALQCGGIGLGLLAAIKQQDSQYYAGYARNSFQQEAERLRNPELYSALDKLKEWHAMSPFKDLIVVGFFQNFGASQYDLYVCVQVDTWLGDTPVSVQGTPHEQVKAQIPNTIDGLGVVVWESGRHANR